MALLACSEQNQHPIDDSAAVSTSDTHRDDPTDTTSGTTSTTPSTTDSGTNGSTTEPGTTTTETTTKTEPSRRNGETEENVRVVFLGDQGLGLDAMAVMDMIKTDNPDLVIWLGDFDYSDSAFLWLAQMELALGSEIPWMAVVGNHDLDAWDDYQPVIETKLATMSDAICTGEVGVQQSCDFKGLRILLSGVGTLGEGHEDWLQDELDADESIWRVCGWHKNQADMQTGEKGDEVGWEAFQICQNNAGFITMGHEHAYSRTMTMTDVGNSEGGHGATGDPEVMEVDYGKTTAIVSGLAGKEIRDFNAKDHDDDSWWATYYTADRYLLNGEEQDLTLALHGALFMTFNVDGDPRKAEGEFINYLGETIDEFEMVTY